MKIKTKHGIFEVLPCPCCGGKKLYVGVRAFCTMGVSCWRYKGGCGLEIDVELPEKLKKPMPMKDVEKMCLNEAVKLWNKRVKNENQSSKSS